MKLTPQDTAYLRNLIEEAHATAGASSDAPTFPAGIEADGVDVGYTEDGQVLVSLDTWRDVMAANRTLAQQGLRYQAAAIRWLTEARRANRLAKATMFLAGGLAIAGFIGGIVCAGF